MKTFVLAQTVFWLLAGSVRAEWGGSVIGSYTDTRSDSVQSQVADQQYVFHVAGMAIPTFRYQALMRFRRLQTNTGRAASTWRTETQPTVSATWANALISTRGEYTYRDYRSRDELNELVGRSFSADAQTNLQGWPQFRARYEWSHNVNNLEVFGQDTRLERVGTSVRYVYRRWSASYELSERRLSNRSGLATLTRDHEGRADYSLALLDRAVTVSSSYRGILRSEKQRRPFDPSTLLPVPASAGLYLEDATPDFGELTAASGLIDGNLENPALPLMDLSSAVYHNLGLDFGTPVEVDRLFLTTDSLANPDQRFAVYVSSDNLSWSQVSSYRTYRFDTVFLRYEMAFSRQSTRYIKLVAEPAPRPLPVYVNELRAYVSRDEQQGAIRSDDHQGVMDLRIRPWSWLQFGLGGTLQRAGRSQTQLAREQDGANASLTLAPAEWFRLSSHYQMSSTDYPGAARDRTLNDLLSFTMETKPLSTLSGQFSVGRQQEWLEQDRFRRAENANVRATLRVFPDLTSSTDFSYVEDHRFRDDNLLFTRSVGQSVDGRPNHRSTVAGEYRIYRLHSRSGAVPRVRTSTSLRASYQLTSALTGRAELDRFDEGGRQSLVSDGGLSWTATPKLQFVGGINRAIYDEGASSTLITGQVFYRASARSDASLSYAHNHYDNDVQPASSNLRLALNINF